MKIKFEQEKIKPSATRTMGFGEDEDDLIPDLEVSSTSNFKANADVKIRAQNSSQNNMSPKN